MPARFRDLLAAEWMKLWSLRSTPWAFAVGAVAALGVNLNATLADHRNYPDYPYGIKELFVPIWAMRDAFTLGGAMVFTLATGSIGALVAGVSFAATQAVLDDRGVGMAIGDAGVLRAVAASALLAPVCALAGFGLGALLRHTATTIVSLTGVLLLLPALMDERDRWGATFLHALPQGAWKRLTEVGVSPVPVDHPWTAGGAWTVYAAWAAVAVTVAFVAVGRRDV
ncbi:hypothetical protein GCM10010222_77720 [Streptomyces tanashiensis]|uniref:ABC transporter permease n=1 Tax=Streptomyces tanashiensis TaxID=67367 RepID=UPI001675C4B2|nr:ABC transporter permease [Streptomyces tanashiensis]GGT24189.1 hypothetical protein GCM10010222_77720 [Streptomyces tanashiensis]